MPFDVRLLYEPRALKIGCAVQYRWERRLYEPCQTSHYMLDVSHHVALLSPRALVQQSLSPTVSGVTYRESTEEPFGAGMSAPKVG